MSTLPHADDIARRRATIERLRAEIRQHEEVIAAAEMERVRSNRLDVDTWLALSPGEQAQMYHNNPAAYRTMMRKVQEHNEAKLLGAARGTPTPAAGGAP